MEPCSTRWVCSLCLLLCFGLPISFVRGAGGNNMDHSPEKSDPSMYNVGEGDLATRMGLKPGNSYAKRDDENAVSTCTAGFRAISGHTMCLPDHPGAQTPGVSREERDLIVDLHNDVRRNVQPPTGNMQQMIWDKRMAEVAQKWAQVCKYGHDEVRRLPDVRASFGQNVFGSTGNVGWRRAVAEWADEVKNFQYGVNPELYLPHGDPSKYNLIGHYTQMVKAETSRIGCGYAVCPNLAYKHRYVCNYSPGQVNHDLRKPYSVSRRCDQCPNFCRKGLCDCGGLVCENHNPMNASVCACNCHRTFSGRDCSKVNCELKDDPFFCTKPKFCPEYWNVPQECPHMCGLCPVKKIEESKVRPEDKTTVEPTSPVFTANLGWTWPPLPGQPKTATSPLFLRGGVGDDDRSSILDMHNEVRAEIGIPALVWDTGVADEAQTWANMCEPRSDPNLCTTDNCGGKIQMRGMGYRTWNQTLEKWRSNPDFAKAMAPALAKIGCGYAACEHKRKTFFFCNYSGGGENVTESSGLSACRSEKNALCAFFVRTDCVSITVMKYCPELCGLC